MMIEWQQKAPGHFVLDAGVIIMTVISLSDTEWVVQSSHGAPTGIYGSEDSAKNYAIRFACTLVEKTLAALSELESQPVAITQGCKPRPCGILILHLDGGARDAVSIARATHAMIQDRRKELRAVLGDLGR